MRVPLSAFGEEGRLVVVSADGASSYLISHHGEDFVAVELVCTHRGCGLQVRAQELHCPCHGSRFSPGGEVLEGPARRPLKTLNVTRKGDELHLES
ncbi:Rieske (2Fe-2S) protein [Bradymonadaceae bacterium TMQ3]|uniref:Rieske (2Fe-2S) protein n=2 Tax=Lujinxingia sediminis TaxID=2480984 RepID=A0ABY0CYL6_9DELT|nr:Rieske (2Fe-2S) protein [Bradymonadaceae bacterium TMQ3]RVU48978.1 Rieske (2Fe-2S) protein [Lujinxingia sediminis]TXC78272.1 Rieske (2Fe-2S) protein [Bradymonadales bacterium TMQ1]